MGSMMGSAPKPPPVVEPPPPPPEAPKANDDAVLAARDDGRRKARAKSGYSGTVLTGDLDEAVTGKTDLGA